MEKFKAQIKKTPILSGIYKLLCMTKQKQTMKKREELFSQNSKKAIAKVQNLLSEENIFFFFDMGTLLGMYRDHKLKKRDMDIDVAIYTENNSTINELRTIMKNNNFRHKFIFQTDEYGIIQDTYEYLGITVDMCYYRKKPDRDVCYLLYDTISEKNLIVELSCHSITAIKHILYNDIIVNAPLDTDVYLSDRYGANWRIPDSTYIYWRGPSARPVKGVGECIHLS